MNDPIHTEDARVSQIVKTLEARKADVEETIQEALARAGRGPDEVTIIAVTKTVDALTAMAAVKAGFHHLGENRPQRLEAMAEALAQTPYGPDVVWHMIGTLQRNKVKRVLPLAHTIHAVDSVRLAERIAALAAERQEPARILLEVNVSGEASKHGFAPDVLKAEWPKLLALPSIILSGLMTMAPLDADRDRCRALFATTQTLLNWCRSHGGETMRELSMGMSQDFEAAVEAGATYVRLGHKLFSDLA